MRVLLSATDGSSEIDMLSARQIVEALRMARQNDQLQGAGWIGRMAFAAHGSFEDFEHLAMLRQVGVGERVVENGERPGF